MKSFAVHTLVTTVACATIVLAAATTPTTAQVANSQRAESLRNEQRAESLKNEQRLESQRNEQLAIRTRFLGLSDKQKADIARVEMEFLETCTKVQNELDKTRRELLAATNRTDIAIKQKEFQATHDTKEIELKRAYDKRCKALLTAEQAARWNGVQIYARSTCLYKDCVLTPEQDNKIQEVCVRYAGQEEWSPSVWENAWPLAMREIEANILTKKQRDDLHVSWIYQGVISLFSQVNLTPEQDTAIRAAINGYLPQYDAVQSDAKALNDIRSKLAHDIRTKILTDEQRARVQRMR